MVNADGVHYSDSGINASQGVQIPYDTSFASYKNDGTTYYPIVWINGNNNISFDSNHHSTYVTFGQGTSHTLPCLLINSRAWYGQEPDDFTVDLPLLGTETSTTNDVHLGNNGSVSATESGNTYFDVITG